MRWLKKLINCKWRRLHIGPHRRGDDGAMYCGICGKKMMAGKRVIGNWRL